MHYATVFSYYKKWNKIFKITQLNKHNMQTQNFLIFFLFWLSTSNVLNLDSSPKGKTCSIFLHIQVLIQISYYKVITALSVRVTIILLVYHLPSCHSSFFTYVNYRVRFGAHHQPLQPNYPPGMSIGLLLLFQHFYKKGRSSYFQGSEFPLIRFLAHW